MPETVNEYREILDGYKALLASKDNDIKRLSEEMAELKNQLLLLKEENGYLRNRIFGRSSEKIKEEHSEQLSLFNEAEEVASEEKEEYTVAPYKRTKKKIDRSIEDKFAGCEHVKDIYDLPESERICPRCGEMMSFVGEKLVRHDLEFIPARVVIHDVYIRSYGCNSCKRNSYGTIVSPTVSEPVIPHSYASASSVAHVMNQKYNMQIPLYRMEQEWKSLGVELSRVTMANWIIYCSEHYLKPLVLRMKQILLTDHYVHADETTVQVLKEPGKSAESKSYMWVYSNIKERENRIRIFEYKPDRKHENAKEFLKGFSGYIISDAYGAYGGIENTKNSLCWAHARRKFHDAIAAGTDEASMSLAKEAVERIGKIFEIEKSIENMSPEEKLEIRNERTKVVLDEFFLWCSNNQNRVLSRSKTGKAFSYALNNEKGLRMFLEDGLLPATNSLDERTIRSFTVGRKNWLFSDSVKGAESSAAAYSIVQSALANGLDVYRYLTYLFEVMPSMDITHRAETLDVLLPWDANIRKVCSANKEKKADD